jgi:photosystem II stability/assembly factor-like uncharacterized protein
VPGIISKSNFRAVMKSRMIAIGLLVMIQTSCRKSNFAPPVVPVIPDTLLNWKQIGNIPDEGLNDILFVSPAKGFIAASRIFQTTDSGKTWTAIPGTALTNGYYNLFFLNSADGFAQGQSELATTTDGGMTWSVKQLPGADALTIFFLSPSTGFYGDETGRGLSRTTDSGNTWVSVFSDPGMPQGYYPFFLNQDTGYAATGFGTFATTTDGGQTWQTQAARLPANLSPGIYNQLLFLDVSNGFYACPSGVFKTTDGGSTWNQVLSVSGVGINVIKFLNTTLGYYVGESMIYKSTDAGQSWILSCKLGHGETFSGMSFPDLHNGWACSIQGRIFRIQQ